MMIGDVFVSHRKELFQREHIIVEFAHRITSNPPRVWSINQSS